MNNTTIERLSSAGIASQTSKREFGRGLPLVIIIDQAHGVLSCKLSTVRILRRLYLWENISLVGVEGAGETLDKKHLPSFDDPILMKRFCASLLLKGELSGVEYWLVADTPEATAAGVEDVALYARMYRSVKETFGVGTRWRDILMALSDALLNPKTGTVSQELLEFIQRVPHREPNVTKGGSELITSIDSLADYAGRLHIETDNYPAVAGGVVGLMALAAGGNTVSLVADLANQMQGLRETIISKLVRTEADRDYINLRELLDLGAKLVNTQCSTSDATRAAGESWTAAAFLTALGMFVDEKTISDFRADGVGFENACRAGLEFYDLLAARSDAMAGRLLEAMHEHKTDVAVLIAGGAHRDGVEAFLASRGVSSLVLQPKMNVASSDQQAYQNRMLGQKDTRPDVDNEKADALVAEMDDDLLALVQETATLVDQGKNGSPQPFPHLSQLVALTGKVKRVDPSRKADAAADKAEDETHVRNEQVTGLRRYAAQVESEMGPNHELTIKVVVGLAGLLEKMKEYDEAEKLYRRSIAALEQASKTDNEDYVAAMNGLANILTARGDHAEAEKLYGRVVATQKAGMELSNPDVILTMNKTATTMQGKGDLAGAETLLRQALALSEQELGEDHVNTLATANNLAGLLEQKGDLRQAEPLLRRSLGALAKATAANPKMLPFVQKVLPNYIGLLVGLGRSEAEALREAVAVLKQAGMNVEDTPDEENEEPGSKDPALGGVRSRLQSLLARAMHGASTLFRRLTRQ